MSTDETFEEYFDRLHAILIREDLDRPVSFEIGEGLAQYMHLHLDPNCESDRRSMVSRDVRMYYSERTDMATPPILDMISYIQIGVVQWLCEASMGGGDTPIVLPRALIPAVTVAFIWPSIAYGAYDFFTRFDDANMMARRMKEMG